MTNLPENVENNFEEDYIYPGVFVTQECQVCVMQNCSPMVRDDALERKEQQLGTTDEWCSVFPVQAVREGGDVVFGKFKQ